jgi:hypothetical protein
MAKINVKAIKKYLIEKNWIIAILIIWGMTYFLYNTSFMVNLITKLDERVLYSVLFSFVLYATIGDKIVKYIIK